MKRFFGIILLLPFLFWGGIRVYKNITFDINCGGHIKRAADANTIDLATQEMKTVVAYLEREGMTSGYTSVIYRTPDEDVGFWHTNLKSSLEELEKVKSETTALERSNLLLKLRETLLDHTNSGESVTAPTGISVFPNNSGFAFFLVLSLILGVIGACLIIVSLDDY